ncbi:hypothetical protein FN846DRAFT_274443 [Sphaerosporella brunnea]|uniref:F-box domain-containing protein n=1 Tax=Sphaerosporella brunnea TaxID=1250544 RepID=A0A5J5EMF1_9PEZI|nr:hypothetical protein FN846DRAFT_274443 [Sphaerosporella brunnea]
MLSTLPTDILFNILAYLSPTTTVCNHPYLALSLVSKRLQAAVEGHTYHLLRNLAKRFPQTAPSFPPQIVSNRRIYLFHASRHCFYCDAPIHRVASVDPGVRCCAECEASVFGAAITGEHAVALYGISELELRKHCAYRTALDRWGMVRYVFEHREVARYIERVKKGEEMSVGARSENLSTVE